MDPLKALRYQHSDFSRFLAPESYFYSYFFLVEDRVLSCQSKPNDNKRLQKNMQWFYKFCLCTQIFRVNFYEPSRFFNF